MSLAVLADHMASKGRGPDSMLIHMSPREVQGLQALAMKHGGSLTINPETGLPEAGFLDKLLPTILGAGLSMIPGVGPLMAAGIVGGIQTIRTGDLGKGIMAGFGAYGGAGLAQGLTTAGGSILSGEATNLAANEAGRLAGEEAVRAGVQQGLSEETINQLRMQAIEEAGNATARVATNATPFEKLAAGAKSATASPEAMGSFAKDNFKNIAYTAAPILADQAVKSNMPTTTTRPGAVRSFSYDPYGQLYTPTGNYEVPVKAAGGGLMGMNDGGYSPGELDFAQRSEPVVRMARGGVPRYDGEDGSVVGAGLTADQAQALVEAQYATIGRSGVGTGAAQIDQSGLQGWKDALVRGDFKPEDLSSRFSTAVTDYMAQNPADQYTNYVKDYRAKQPGTTGAKVETVDGGGDIGFTSNAVTTGGTTSLGNVGDLNYVARDPGVITATNQYFAANPDVAAAFAVNNYGLTAEQFAQTHYDKYGSKEQRSTPLTATSNSNAYLLANPDVAAEYARNSYGMTPAELAAYHSNTYGNAEQRATPLAEAQNMVANMYRNVLGRDPDPEGLAFWSSAIAAGRSPESIYKDFLTSARANTELVTADQVKNATFADATKAYKGYTSADTSNIVDEWVRNTLGREPTAADKAQQWYKDAFTSMKTQGQAQGLYGQFQTYAGAEAKTETANRIKAIDAELKAKGLTEADLLKQTGKTKQQLATEGLNTDLNWMGASQLAPLGSRTAFDLQAALKKLTPITNTNDGSVVARTVTNPYGNATNPGDLTYNRDGSTTVTPNIPYRPYGGFPGMASVRDAYTQGGGSLGYIPDTPKTMEEFEDRYGYKTPSGSKEAYDRLTGKTKYSPVPYTETGEIMKPYAESVMGVPGNISSKKVLFDPVTRKYKNNPDYVPVSYTSKGEKVYGLSSKDIAAQLPDVATSDYEKWTKDNNVTLAQIAAALNISLAEAKKRYPKLGGKTSTATDDTASNSGSYDGGGGMATGGLAAMAGGGMAGQFDLGGYSDGGRLLRGPGDGVSDSIPATIGNKRPARLADGEFVVPARIVSELGNGSTEAGARKLYAMMDRVQAARRGTVGKGRVAKNSRSDKYLPA